MQEDLFEVVLELDGAKLVYSYLLVQHTGVHYFIAYFFHVGQSPHLIDMAVADPMRWM